MSSSPKFTYFLLISLFVSLCIHLSAFAFEPPSIDNDTSIQSLNKNDQGETIMSTGPDVKYSSSQVSETKHQMFCESNTFTIQVERRVEDSNDETIVIFNINAELNGQRVDFFKGEGMPESVNDSFVVDADMSCIEDEWVIYLTGYNDSETRSGATLASLKIDAYSGKLK